MPSSLINTAKTPRRKRLLGIVLILAVVAGGLGAGGILLWNQYGERIALALGWSSNDFTGKGEGEVVITIAPGDYGEQISTTLATAGVVKTSTAFYELLLSQDPAVTFQPGAYQLRLGMSAQAALNALQDPATRVQLRAVIPEGKTVDQTLELLSSGANIPLSELQSAAANPAAFGLPADAATLEGWLFPASYEFEPNTTATDALGKMVGLQIALLDELGVPVADRERVLTIASIVEREAGRAEDFGKVSRVISNRTEMGMLLQMDSTVQYGYEQHEDGTVWSSDEALRDNNPWNTYVNSGLPIGPIANPGRAAIEATLNPEPGDWIYFVAVNLDTGESKFSATIEDHNAGIEVLNQWCRANPGRGC